MFEELQNEINNLNNSAYDYCEVSIGCENCDMKSICYIYKARNESR